MDQEKLLQLQLQMRNNNDDYKNFLDDMDSWSNEMKSKENEINLSDTKKVLPQIRNTSACKKPKIKQTKIKAYDYQAWDKFDVDKALKECDKEEMEISENKNLEYSIRLKEEGNTLFKNGDYLSAVSKYTEALSYDNNNDVLFTNRAMSYLKLGNFEAGESDCSQAIFINSKSVKSFYRRAKCRIFLNKREEALSDYKIVLNIEPNNKLAFKEMKELEMELNTRGIVEPLYEPLKNRISTNPLKRIEIIDVDPNKSFDGNNNYNNKTEEKMEISSVNNVNNLSENRSLQKEKSIINEINEKVDLRIPKNSVQLTKDLSNFRRNFSQLANYVINIDCSSYNKLIGHALDSELLLDIVNGLSWAVKLDLLSHEKFVESFKHLHKVSRFSSTWLMISSEEKIHFDEVIRLLDKDLLNKFPLFN